MEAQGPRYRENSIYRDSVDGPGATVFKREIELIIARAEAIGRSIVDENHGVAATTAQSTVHVCAGHDVYVLPHYRSCYISPWYSGWYYPMHTTHVVHHYEGNSSGRESDNAMRWLAGLAFAMIAGVAAYMVGKDWGASGEATEELQRIQQERDQKLARYIEDGYVHPHMDRVRALLEGEERLFAKVRSDTATGLVLKISLLAGSVLGFLGALTGAPAALTAGAVAVFAAGIFMLVRIGLNSTSRRAQEEAVKLLELTRELRAIRPEQVLRIHNEAL